LIDLAADAGPRQTAAGAEASIVAERAAPRGYGAIDIWAGEAGIDADFLNPSAKTLSEKETTRVVW
jgi:hypothetical protein